MAITYAKFFAPTVLGVVAATLFIIPSPASTLFRGGRVRLTNTTAGPVSVTLYAVPVAGTAGVGNAFILAKMVGANDYLDVDVPIMAAGDFLQALAGSATSITAQVISGAYFA
jgi:hypothetical protein